jgi:cytochrome b6-f complex iron-sulfur subunit
MEDMAPRACSPTLSFFTSVNVADVMPGTARLILTPQTRFFLCRDDKGIYAVDAACTHKGTDVNFVSAEAGFSCPLHGATFDFNGEKPGAPATEPLTHYLVCTTASGTIVVDTEQPVPAGVRYRV